MITTDTSCRLLEVDFSGIEAVITGRCLWAHGFGSEGAKQYIRLARLGMHAAVTALKVGQPVDLTQDDKVVKSALNAVKKAYEKEYDTAKRTVHCLPGDHEVLTPQGWCRLDQLPVGRPVAQWWPDGTIDFVRPTDYHEAEGTHTLQTWTGRGLRARMTSQHRVPIVIAGYLQVDRTAAKPGEHGRIPVCGTLTSEAPRTYRACDIQLVTAVQADGGWQGKWIRFHLHRPRKIARLRSILDACGIAWTSQACSDGRGVVIRIVPSDVAALELLETYRDVHTTRKWWSLFNLLNLCTENRRTLLTELPHWDGVRGGERGRQTTFLTKHRRNADAIQTLAHITGMQSYVQEYNDNWRASLARRTHVRVSSLERNEEHYQGTVYCLTVPSSWFLIRYRDRISVTGNSINFGMSAYGRMEKFPEFFPTLQSAHEFESYYFSLAPDLPKWHLALRKQAREAGFLGGPTKPGATPTIWDHPYGYRHWFWDVFSYKPCNEFTARKWLRDPARAGRIVYMHGRPFQVTPGGDWNRVVALYPQSTAAGRLKEAQRRLFLPWSDDYIGDCYFGRTPLLGPIHDSLLLHIPNRCFDRVTEIVLRVMQEPSSRLPIPPEWGWGPYLPIGVSAKAGRNWAPAVDEDRQQKIYLQTGVKVPLNESGMEEIDVPAWQWVEHAGEDPPVLPTEGTGEEEDWNMLKRSVA